MPELPEVETMCRGIRGTVGATIQRLIVPRCRYRPILITPTLQQFRKRAVGQQIQEVQRLGKRPMLKLDSGDRIVFEPRMTGLLLIADPPDTSHLRLGFALQGSAVSELWFWDRRGLGNIRLLTEMQWKSDKQLSKLGPDALKISADDLRNRLRSSQRAIKIALLDQSVLAGVGNLYASEILHMAKVGPRRMCRRITKDEWSRIHRELRSILQNAIRYEGSTLSDGTFRNALNQDGSYQNRHRVYMRADEPCLSCQASKIRRIVQAQRSTFYCPRCQR